MKNERIDNIFNWTRDVLGGLPENRSCYSFDDKVVYDLIKKKDFFKNGLKRLTTANEKQIKLAIMCSESKPEECHRSRLIGQELLKEDISLKHIISNCRIKTQQDVMNELTKGKGTVDLFGQEIDFTSQNHISNLSEFDTHYQNSIENAKYFLLILPIFGNFIFA